MSSFNLRASGIPTNAIIMNNSTSGLSFAYSHESSLFNKYPKGIPNLCTQPGGAIGCNNHLDPCTNPSHNHTGVTSHNHVATSNSQVGACFANSAGGTGTNAPTHTHSWNVSNASPSVTVCTSSSAHTHNSQTLEPVNQTIRYIRRIGSNVRASYLRQCDIIWYSKTIASLPSHFSIVSALTNNRFYKGVPNACTSPGTQAGVNCHTHGDSTTTHTHSYTLPSHNHTHPSVTAGSNQNDRAAGGGCAVSVVTHTHTISGSTGSTGNSGTTSIDTPHSHSGISHLPLHRELLPITSSNTISIRKRQLPAGAVLLWLCNLSNIPPNFQVANGTNGTICTLDRYARSVPTSATDPGTGAGASSHQHGSQTHTHNAPFSHTHTICGTTGAGAASTPRCTGGVQVALITHTHTYTGDTGQIVGTTLVSGSHQHPTTNNDPSAIRVAYIERI